MVKILIGLIAALVVAAGGYFGFEFYVQQRVAGEVEAAFAAARQSGAQASHGKVAFDLWTRTITVADISGESAAKPPVTVRIGRFTAEGAAQPDPAHFTASRIQASNVEVSGAATGGLVAAYKAPRVEVKDYSGPAGPLRQLDAGSSADVYRFALEHFAAVSASAITIPSVTGAIAGSGASAAIGSGEYTYSGLNLRDIKDGRIAAITIDKVALSSVMNIAGKPTKMTGEAAALAAYDFDSAAPLAMFDPAKAKDDRTYRAYRQMTMGRYEATIEPKQRIRLEGMTFDDIGVKPSRLQFPELMAIIESMPPAGANPSPAQLRDMLEKIAVLYRGIRVGAAEVRGITLDLPEGPFRLGAIRLANLEDGKLGEFALEGLDGRTPNGPVKLGRFALKSLDVAGLMRVAGQFAALSGQNPAPDQLLGLLLLLEGTEIKGVVAPYKNTGQPVNIDTLNLSWGQFVGPIPTKARFIMKMSGPLDAADPDLFKMLVASGLRVAAVNVDLGAAWSESAKSFALEPVTLEIGGVMTAAARLSVGNVQRETFSVNPLQAAIMAAQIEAGPIEIALRDTGGIDLMLTQYARTQNVSVEAARKAITDNIRDNAMKMAAVNPDVMAIAGALTRFIENPRGTLSVKLTPKGKVAVMQIIEAMKTAPIAALARFQVQATNGR